jgi:hypothetical protein
LYFEQIFLENCLILSGSGSRFGSGIGPETFPKWEPGTAINSYGSTTLAKTFQEKFLKWRRK